MISATLRFVADLVEGDLVRALLGNEEAGLSEAHAFASEASLLGGDMMAIRV